MTAQEWIEERKRLADAAAEGPWGEEEIVRAVRFVRTDGFAFPEDRARELAVRERNINFIADSRTSLPAALAALESVLARHEPAEALHCQGKSQRLVRICVACSLRHGDDGPWIAWPCPDVRTITAALGCEL